MINSNKIGNETNLPFVNECLIKAKADFFNAIKKANLDIALKETKNIRKAVLVMKEDREAFGVMLGEEVNLEQEFWYPFTSVSLSISRFDSYAKSKTLFP